jgi:hypothetical protein
MFSSRVVESIVARTVFSGLVMSCPDCCRKTSERLLFKNSTLVGSLVFRPSVQM